MEGEHIQIMAKRFFDIITSFLGLVLVFPLLLLIALMIKKESPGPVFYIGKRVGRGGKVFSMYKFRSMVPDADKLGGPSTSGDDPRLLKIGKLLRKYQLDELPQLINVLLGEMSIVGPRPEVLSEVETYDEETKKIIFSVKPGMSDLATLANLHEEEVLRGASDPHEAYRRLIKPQKLSLAKQYVRTRSFRLDLKIILKTLKSAIF